LNSNILSGSILINHMHLFVDIWTQQQLKTYFCLNILNHICSTTGIMFLLLRFTQIRHAIIFIYYRQYKLNTKKEIKSILKYCKNHLVKMNTTSATFKIMFRFTSNNPSFSLYKILVSISAFFNFILRRVRSKIMKADISGVKQSQYFES